MDIELTEKEKLLIQAVRDLDEPCSNILLWYASGLEESVKRIEGINPKAAELDKIKVAKAEEWMLKM